MKRLKYFTSIQTEDSELSLHSQWEDILQQEHAPSGKHPIASSSNSGFMTSSHVQQLEDTIKRLNDLIKKVNAT